MWVKCKNNGRIRYVTRAVNSRYFEDDGKMSGKSPSPSCWWDNYEPLYAYDLGLFSLRRFIMGLGDSSTGS